MQNYHLQKLTRDYRFIRDRKITFRLLRRRSWEKNRSSRIIRGIFTRSWKIWRTFSSKIAGFMNSFISKSHIMPLILWTRQDIVRNNSREKDTLYPAQKITSENSSNMKKLQKETVFGLVTITLAQGFRDLKEKCHFQLVEQRTKPRLSGTLAITKMSKKVLSYVYDDTKKIKRKWFKKEANNFMCKFQIIMFL